MRGLWIALGLMCVGLTPELAVGQDWGGCPPWRPCGGGNTFGGNFLMPQGFYGVDFRPACAQHDACLANPYNSRFACDQQFLAGMYDACACSPHPLLCRHKARMYYVGTRMFGTLYRQGAP